MKAVKSSTGDVSAKDLVNAANAGHLSRQTRNNLKALADTVQEKLSALDKFTSKDRAAAMEKNANGMMDWKADNKAAMAFTAA